MSMDQDWDKAIEFTLRMEGGESSENVPGDPGGVTKFGISKQSYPDVDIVNLTLDQAKAIYQRDYWYPCSCSELPAPFAIAIFDTAVNQGVEKARRILQVALGVDVDGVIGPKTVLAAHRADPDIIKRFLAQRLTAYMSTIAKNPALLQFAFNWSHRVLSLADFLRRLP